MRILKINKHLWKYKHWQILIQSLLYLQAILTWDLLNLEMSLLKLINNSRIRKNSFWPTHANLSLLSIITGTWDISKIWKLIKALGFLDRLTLIDTKSNHFTKKNRIKKYYLTNNLWLNFILKMFKRTNTKKMNKKNHQIIYS